MIGLPPLSGAKVALVIGFAAGALAAWGPASCVGKSQANQATALRNAATAAKLQATAAKMGQAAALTEMALAARTKADVIELREIVRVEATTDAAGPGVDAVMQRLRRRTAR